MLDYMLHQWPIYWWYRCHHTGGELLIHDQNSSLPISDARPVRSRLDRGECGSPIPDRTGPVRVDSLGGLMSDRG